MPTIRVNSNYRHWLLEQLKLVECTVAVTAIISLCFTGKPQLVLGLGYGLVLVSFSLGVVSNSS